MQKDASLRSSLPLTPGYKPTTTQGDDDGQVNKQGILNNKKEQRKGKKNLQICILIMVKIGLKMGSANIDNRTYI